MRFVLRAAAFALLVALAAACGNGGGSTDTSSGQEDPLGVLAASAPKLEAQAPKLSQWGVEIQEYTAEHCA